MGYKEYGKWGQQFVGTAVCGDNSLWGQQFVGTTVCGDNSLKREAAEQAHTIQ